MAKPSSWLNPVVAPTMPGQRSGAIVHVSAPPGRGATYGMVPCSATKAAPVRLTRTLDVELRPMGILVNSIGTEVIDMETNRKGLPEEMLGRAVSPDALADVTAFLISDVATPMSGTTVPAYG